MREYPSALCKYFWIKNVEAQECLIALLALVLMLVVQVKTGIKELLIPYCCCSLTGKQSICSNAPIDES